MALYRDLLRRSFHRTKAKGVHTNGFGLRNEEGGFAAALGAESRQQLSFVVKKRKSLREGRESLLYLERSAALFLC